jgi:predicted CXXCH cytochrome family protein
VWLVLAIAIVLGGCFSSRPKPDVSGTPVAAEACEACHAERSSVYAQSLHAAKGIRCGQCHPWRRHPEAAPEPVRDATCGGCHTSQLQQTLASKHFASRVSRALDGDLAARAALRRDGFTAPAAERRHFVGDAASGPAGGRLCAGCHYDEHRLGLGSLQRAEFCLGCHAGQKEHFEAEGNNRCVTCHVRVGQTVTGQTVDTHRFTKPGDEGTGK